MKVKIFKLLPYINQILLTFSFNTFAQQASNLPNPDEVYRKYVSQNNYITPIFELKAQKVKYLPSSKWRQVYLEMMIQLQDDVGNHDEAYRLEKVLYDGFPASKRKINFKH